MAPPLLILALSGPLFFFSVQQLCEGVLQREFSHRHCEYIVKAIQLEYPRLRDAIASNAVLDFARASRALKCDFMTLEYLLKNGDGIYRQLPRREKILFLYFRFLLFCLPTLHALRLKERGAALNLAMILQYFVNLVGEKLSVNSLDDAQPSLES